MQYREFDKDLFTVPKHFALVHCISADAEMGKGIARLFRDKYTKMQRYIRKKSPKVGDCIMYEANNGQIIFNLVTKKEYDSKPTYRTLEVALSSLFYQTQDESIRRLAMPAIGCGLDRLKWATVSQIVQATFNDADMKIAVCFHE